MLPPSRSNHQDAEAAKSSGILHRNLKQLPLKVVGASGNYLTLSNGQQILDATGGAAVSCLGHGDKRVQDAVMRQMNEAAYCHSLFFSTAAAEALGEELVLGSNREMAKAFIVSSGSEAIEAAMKLARQYHLEISPSQPQRTKFIARKESYHGTTLGSLSLGGHVSRRALFEPMLLENISRVSACNAYRGKADGEGDEEYVARLAKELDEEFQRLGPDTVCAFVAEPVVGAALGCVPSVPGYFKAVKAVCDKYGALLIMDEIMSGMGRTGTLHAWQQEGVVPDIQTIGKGLGGGYAPVAGVLINHRVVGALEKGTGSFSHGQTYQGHPLACAAAAEVQRIIREDHLCENVRAMGGYLEELLKKKLETHPNVGNIRGRGLFWGIEFVKDKATKEPFDPRLGVAMGVHEKGMEPKYSISIYPGTGTVDGKSGDHVLLAPAYNVTKADVEKIVDLTTAVITEFFAEL
ncbi:putative aminotransferase [Lasiodiplodia hormozganensis]|uniref:Aminotransferase n=1 Tax=Lasiodiplodia hormozganensis TaxID=869390 RepID=A0AA39YVF6_9PEZI|nr:putative aminotransferase [Lasiodiplodia hormozganensis]